MEEIAKPFDPSAVRIFPLTDREHDLNLDIIRPLEPRAEVLPAIADVAGQILQARKKNAAVVLMMGAHVIRAGVQRHLIDMMEKGQLSCIAMNGAGIIHDYEFALVGGTTESVARYIRSGHFGMWRETGRLNDIVRDGAAAGMGMGEAAGRYILENDLPHKEISLLACAKRCGVPVTAHVGIGYDIIHQHPNFDPAATATASYRDFLTFAGVVDRLEGGVLMNFGSAVMGPEIFLKALSMARNVAHREQRRIDRFTTLVCDLHDIPETPRAEAPKTEAAYYFRPWKTLLVRTIQDGGQGYYVRGRHEETIPALWTALQNS